MGFIPIEDYLKLPRPEHPWIVEDLLPQKGLLSMYGHPKAGKSFLALQMASAIATPETPDFLGLPIRHHCRVAYFQLDTPREAWVARIHQLIEQGYTFPPERVFICDKEDEDLPYPFYINQVDDRGVARYYEWLRARTKPIAPEVVVLDCLREAHYGGPNDENQSGHMQNVIALLTRAVPGAAYVILSHARKSLGDTSSLIDDNRGSSYLAGRADCIMKVSRRSITYVGRSVEETKLGITVGRDGVRVVSDKTIDRIKVLLQHGGHTERQIAEILEQEFKLGLSTDGYRWRIKRVKKQMGMMVEGGHADT